MKFINAKVFHSGGDFKLGSFCVSDDKFASVLSDDNDLDKKIYDCKAAYVIPGLIDIHFHGCVGHDFCEASFDAISAIANYELNHGITSICPATMTYTEEILKPVMKVAAGFDSTNTADLVGINMEGPFISENKVGAQNPKYVQRPNYEMLENLQTEANGLIKLVDIAPEVDGAFDFIKQACDNYNISIAHTVCDYETASIAFDLGCNHLTHTYNAMPGISHRAPGPIVAAAEHSAYAEIICDGQHIDYPAVRLAFKLFGADKMCLISDSCEATGLGDGQYSLGGQAITKTGTKVVLSEAPQTIAASATNLFDCMKHAIFDAGIDKRHAIAAATINPARSIGIQNLYGSIENGKIADFLILDNDFKIKAIYKRGKLVKGQ